MSVSGASGGVGPTWDPAATTDGGDAAASDAGSDATVSRTPTSGGPGLGAAASALLGSLKDIEAGADAWLPGWLKSFDTAGGVHRIAKRALQDGSVSAADVEELVNGAFDFGEMQPVEKEALTQLLNENASAFEPAARQAFAAFLDVADPLAGTGDPGTGPVPTGTFDLDLPTTAGKDFQVDARGFLVESGESQGPPGLHSDGAERIYRGGRALVDAPAGVLKGVPAEVQTQMIANATAWYDAALAETQSSTLDSVDANKVRSGAAAQLIAVMEGAQTPEIANQAAQALINLSKREPLEGLRASNFINLDAHADKLSGAVKAELGDLQKLVLPETPPYEKWFPNGDETFEVVHYAHDECWEHATDPVTRYKREGMEVTETGTNEHGEEFWVLEGEIDGGEGSMQKTRIQLVKSHDEFCRDMDNPDIHAVIYSGHSNLGGNVSEAIKRGPEGNGDKLLSFQVCRGQQNLFEVMNKYPNAHLSTSHDPSYFANMMDISIGTLKGVARRDTYGGINEGTRMSLRREDITNYIRPNEMRRFNFTDGDQDGQPEIGRDIRDRFFDVLVSEPASTRTDLEPRNETRPAMDIDGTAVMNGAMFARTLVTYHNKYGAGDSPLAGIKGDRIEANGYFEGSDEAVRIEETTGEDGKPVINVSVNKDYANQSAFAIGALIQFEMTRHFAEKDGSFSPEDKARGLLMTGQYLAYMYTSHSEARGIMRSIGERAGLPNLGFQTVMDAIDADDHGYVTDGQVNALLNEVSIR